MKLQGLEHYPGVDLRNCSLGRGAHGPNFSKILRSHISNQYVKMSTIFLYRKFWSQFFEILNTCVNFIVHFGILMFRYLCVSEKCAFNFSYVLYIYNIFIKTVYIKLHLFSYIYLEDGIACSRSKTQN